MLALLLLAAANPLGCEAVTEALPLQSQTQDTTPGAMSTPRGGFTLTLLSDGRVVAAGGSGNGPGVQELASCDLYSPATGEWSATGALSTGRHGHSAVLLTDGRVMVIGGSVGVTALSSVELYDPATGTWSAGPAMPFPQSTTNSVVLPDGRVFVVGVGAKAALFDPATSTWTVLPDQILAHNVPVLTLLLDGRVLVSGYPGAEIFDPATSTWTRPIPVVGNRDNHAATLLANGRVLFTGGFDLWGTPLKTAEVFDPATNTAQATGSMSVARFGHRTWRLADGTVLVTGGKQSASSTELDSVERYEPATGLFSQRVTLQLARSFHEGVQLDSGLLLIAGGSTQGPPGAKYTAASELYDPTACYTSCAQLGKNCGSLGDGCGGTFECGTCAGGETCNANVCGDITAPAVTFTSPKRYEFVHNTITLTANATDASGVTRVEFYVDPLYTGEPSKLIGTVTGPGPTYSVNWDSRTTLGNILRAKAYDAAGNVGTTFVEITWRNGSPVVASYDSTRMTLVCGGLASRCDSGSQFNGRGLLGPEPHAPNTLRNTCYDSQEGTYHVNESLDALSVATLDDTPIAQGRRVKIEAKVWASATYTSDRLILLRATDVDSGAGPTWTHVATLYPTAAGLNTLSTTTLLPAGSVQAFRGVFGKNSVATLCSPYGSYDDRDDLVFFADNEPDAVPPTVALSAPVNGSILTGAVVLQASASDNFGVTEVGFFDNGQFLGSVTTEPFTFTWNSNGADNGPHTLTARALDLKGNIATSAAVEVTLDNDKTAPTVAITSPATGATLSGNVSVQVIASDNVAVRSLLLKVDGQQNYSLGGPNLTSASMPLYTQSLSNGPHTLVVQALDAAGNAMSSASVQVTVFNDITAPTVAITAPVNGAEVSGWVSIPVNANDNVAVSRVEFYLDGVLLMTRVPPDFTGSFNSALYNNGPYTLTAKAFDAAGNSAASAAVTVLVNNAGAASNASYDAALKVPRCAVGGRSCDSGTLLNGRGLVGPEPHASNTLDNCTDSSSGTYHSSESLDRLKVSTVDGTPLAAGKRVRVEATVWAYNASYDTLELYSAPNALSPVWTLLTMVTPGYSNPQTLSTTFVLPAGPLQAIRGVFRSGGVQGACIGSGSNVDRDDLVFPVATEADGVAPTVAITSPASGSTLEKSTTVAFTADDNFGVTKVELYVDGALAGTSTVAPFSLTWSTVGLTNGPHSLTAVAYDLAGNTTTSAAVGVTVSNDLTPPTVFITSPAEGALGRGTMTLAASATDNVAVTKVEFYVDGARRFSTTVAPYSFNWNSMVVGNGSHTLVVMAYDATTNVGTSPPVTFTTENDLTPPTVAMTSPANGAVLSGTVTLTADAADAYGISRVDFYVDTLMIGSATTAPYAVSVNTVLRGNGSHTLKAIAYDTASNSATSQVLTVTISNDSTPPTVALVSPVSGAVVSGTILLSANASDNVGVASVRFYINSVLLGTVSSAPYQLAWNTSTVTNGSASVRAEAVDTSGLVSPSSTVSVTVSNSAGGGAQVATYDDVLRVPKCSARGVSCDSSALLTGRGSLGPEPHQPNALGACSDGTSGSFHSDESLDRLKVTTLDGTVMLPGKTVRVEATVWAYSGYSSDKLDLYYAASATSPSWTLLTTLTPTAAGSQTLTATFTLPTGTLQAVRGVFRYGGSMGSCPGGTYTDVDDLVFVTQ
ncbi:hypothetical protein KH5H1_04950 [Corallococcus caeni]|nr:hypothetical protein KH5H1_04950 [Corallococcus sp. KH5-1]